MRGRFQHNIAGEDAHHLPWSAPCSRACSYSGLYRPFWLSKVQGEWLQGALPASHFLPPSPAQKPFQLCHWNCPPTGMPCKLSCTLRNPAIPCPPLPHTGHLPVPILLPHPPPGLLLHITDTLSISLSDSEHVLCVCVFFILTHLRVAVKCHHLCMIVPRCQVGIEGLILLGPDLLHLIGD